MPPKDLDPTESPYAFFGSELRRLREGAGLSQAELAKLVFQASSYISHIETAFRTPELELVERIDAALGASGHLTRVFEMATRAEESSSVADYFAAVAEMEPRARRIDWFGDSLFPGLLQTEEYAEALIRTNDPFRTEAAIADLMAGRSARAQLLERPNPPALTVVLDESALRRKIGGRAVMARQLAHTATLVRDRRIVVQVIGFDAGAHPLVAGQLVIVHFADAPPVAYMEGSLGGFVAEKQERVDRAMLSYHLTCAAALSPDASLALLESVAEEYST
ncbi:helix-turn-helix domain-containing protein [Streptomyces wuyuanensis]|uniref:helix-turn-helix domain-containing protein n=1 Tax=Streptomyces wuyuanensis TaxID=1196353 RepID=UPI00341D1B1B